jgi:thiosulfate/3-mercaptopyruvate sulfurtransferase
MPYAISDGIVSTDWLERHLEAPDVRVVDATWHHPSSGRKGRDDYDRAHIPGAVYFDIDEIAESASPLPHMLPEAAKFASKVKRLGLGNGLRMVIYDRAAGGSAAARVWWTFRVFGHTDVAVLDGGFDKWQREGRPVEDLPPMPRERHFMPAVNHFLVRSKEQMLANAANPHEQVIDARSAARFAGRESEPWPQIKAGHIPDSINLPWGELLDKDEKVFLPAEAMRQRFAAAGVDLTRRSVATCGSGVTACVLALGLYLLGNRDVAVYDGSFAEWGTSEETPVVVNP